jgi:hypothetical protein
MCCIETVKKKSSNSFFRFMYCDELLCSELQPCSIHNHNELDFQSLFFHVLPSLPGCLRFLIEEYFYEIYNVSECGSMDSGFEHRNSHGQCDASHGSSFTHFRIYRDSMEAFEYDGPMLLNILDLNQSVRDGCDICKNGWASTQGDEFVLNSQCACEYCKGCIDEAIRRGCDSCPNCDPKFCTRCLFCDY